MKHNYVAKNMNLFNRSEFHKNKFKESKQLLSIEDQYELSELSKIDDLSMVDILDKEFNNIDPDKDNVDISIENIRIKYKLSHYDINRYKTLMNLRILSKLNEDNS